MFAADKNPLPGLSVHQSAGLCYYHWTFSNKAHSREARCA